MSKIVALLAHGHLQFYVPCHVCDVIRAILRNYVCLLALCFPGFLWFELPVYPLLLSFSARRVSTWVFQFDFWTARQALFMERFTLYKHFDFYPLYTH